MPDNPGRGVFVALSRKLTFRTGIPVLLTVLFLWVYGAFAQSQQGTRRTENHSIDSLKRLMPSLHDSARVDVLNKISSTYCRFLNWELVYKQTDSARLYALRASKESRLIGYTRGLARAYQNHGEIESERGNFQNAEQYFRLAIPLYKKLNQLNELNETFVSLGWSLFEQAGFQEARTILEVPLHYYESVSNEELESRTLRLIGDSYAEQGYYFTAFEYTQKDYLRSRKSGDTFGNLFSPERKGDLFLVEGDTTMALMYYRQSADYAKAKGLKRAYYERMAELYFLKKEYASSILFRERYYQLILAYRDDVSIQKRWLMINNQNLGKLYRSLGNNEKSIGLLQESLQFFTKGNELNRVMHILLDLAKAYDARQDHDKTLYYAQELLRHGEHAGARQVMRDGYWFMWRAFDRQHKVDSAYSYHLKYTALNHAIDSDEHQRKIAAADWIVKDEQQQAQIDLLDRNNKIEQHQVQSESLMKKIYAGSLIAFVLLGAILFRNLVLNRKNEKLISEQKQSALQKQTNELEMQALRAQMSPHFIFNSLNSINRFILQNEKVQASEYLTKFSKLIRLILQNSQAALIPLESELESLRLYLDLEALRFNHHFTYTVSVDKELDISSLKVPPLVIQPYAENAIWHGLMHKEEKGQLDIALYLERDHLLLKITDDGIGRKQAFALASKSATRNKSLGLKITADRIALLQTDSSQASVVIHDLIHPDGSPAGTEVIIKIPALYD